MHATPGRRTWFADGDQRGIALGIAVVVLFVVSGLLFGEANVPAMAVIIAPFIACATSRPPAVVLVGAVTLVGVGILVAVYHFDPLHVAIRALCVVVATGVAAYLSWERGRLDTSAELLRERNELALRFELLLREAPVGFLLADTDLRIVVVNEKLAALRGLDPSDFVGRLLTEVHGVSGAAADLQRIMGDVLAAEDAVLELALADGEPDEPGTREFQANVFPVAREDEVVGVGVTVVEVTERNRSARYLEELLVDRDRVARALQESLLPPSLPEPERLAFSASYLPAGTGADIGGDFYDVFETVDGCWHVVVGDICGKGLAAATQIGLARHTLRAACIDHPDPADTLALLNTVLYQQDDADRFLTAAHVVLDLSHGTVSCTVGLGGHPPPLLVRGGEVRELGSYGPLLGIHDEVELTSTEVELQVGDLVVAYTDGLIEDRHGRFGEADLRALLGTVDDAPADEVVTCLERRLAEERPGPSEDDVAIVAVRVER